MLNVEDWAEIRLLDPPRPARQGDYLPQAWPGYLSGNSPA